jgi:glyoxalase family protein
MPCEARRAKQGLLERLCFAKTSQGTANFERLNTACSPPPFAFFSHVFIVNDKMNTPTGIHHVTAIASDPQANVDFYAGLLGLRLVKKTVNFDDPSAYHLYYGDETGTPGSIMTFFYWPGHGSRGRVGPGQMTRLAFSAPRPSLDFWHDRLTQHGIKVERGNRFGEDVLAFADPDGIPCEIVAVANDSRQGWAGGGVPAAQALRGFHTAELTVRTAAPTEKLLTGEMGCRLLRREGNRARFEAGPGGSGRYIDVIGDATAAPGMQGTGTVHHVAWRVPDDASQLAMQEVLANAGYSVSEVRDRFYFHSIYYRERGSILFEIATDTPGFPVDEPVASLGTALKLPQQFERVRKQIEVALPPLQPARRYA